MRVSALRAFLRAVMPKSTRSLPAAKPDDTCSVCSKTVPCRPLASMRAALVEHLSVQGLDPSDPSASVCAACLSSALSRHTLHEVKRRRAALPDVEKEIASRARAIADEIESGIPASAGQRAADAVARVGGSWGFVLGFIVLITAWTVVNAVILVSRPFDPYPFILLNLALSCLAAIQAPIILMSQSRMAHVDRIRATEDFRVNLKAELEVASLHEKIDHLMHQQWDRMLELQQIQLEILEQLHRHSALPACSSAEVPSPQRGV